MSPLHEPLLTWYDENARELPWRGDAATPWSVMVSEFRLQRTPVVRVLPVHAAWMERWPTPTNLAAEPPGEAVRAWGRLGYPRRALRLHAAAVAIVEQHGGQVPSTHADLLALPGVGPWTAEVIAMRALGDPDAFPASDLGLRLAAGRVGLPTAQRNLIDHSTRWRPWRSYVTQHLWTTLEHPVNRWPPKEVA